jgi:uncharacterized membrane protein YeaQ/YmgE (transglycosylase-associated protein family)
VEVDAGGRPALYKFSGPVFISLARRFPGKKRYFSTEVHGWCYERPSSGEEEIMFALLWELIIGLLVGAVAKLLMPGKDGGGIWITMALGIAGSILATYLGRFLGWYQEGQAAGFIMSVVGAILLLLIYRLIRRKAA